MTIAQEFFLAYLALPFFLALSPRRARDRLWLGDGALGSIVRILILLFLCRGIVAAEQDVSVSANLMSGYPFGFVFSLDAYRFGFLITAEFCFLLAHWLSPANAPQSKMIRALICFAQGFCSLFLVSNNNIATGALLFLAGAVFFYLLRFSFTAEEGEDVGESIASRIYMLFSLLGLLMIAWGINEFKEFGAAEKNPSLGLLFWLGLMVIAVPLPPWSRWFGLTIDRMPEGVTLTLVTFLAAVAAKFVSLGKAVHGDLHWKQKLMLYSLGLMGCAFSMGKLFAAKSRRSLLGSLPSFFFSMLLLSLGLAQSSLPLSAYFICIFVPVFTGLALYASMMEVRNPLQRIFVGLLAVICLGIPGTPVFLIFSAIGARSLELGAPYTILFGLIWFFYFSSNVYLCRRFFIDDVRPERAAPSPQISGGTVLFAGFGILMMILVVAVTQIAGRIL